MSISTNNIAADYHRSVSASYANVANFQRTQEAIKKTNEVAAPTKPTKVTLKAAVRDSQQIPASSLKVSGDIRQFLAKERSLDDVDFRAATLTSRSAETARVAHAMTQNAKSRKPLFQSERKPLAVLA